MPESIELLGVHVHAASMNEALQNIERFTREKKPHLVITLGTEMVIEARKNAAFRNLVNGADLVLPDGGGLVWASRVTGNPLQGKVAGIELLENICRLSGEKNWRLFFLGGKPGIARRAAEKIKARYLNAKIAGVYHGYFDEKILIPEILVAKPDILLCGLGSPKQEFWLAEHLEKLKIPVGIGVGGSFDVLAGKLRRAPQAMIRLNLEWLFRFFQEPKRLRRILKIPYFMSLIYLEKLKGGKEPS